MPKENKELLELKARLRRQQEERTNKKIRLLKAEELHREDSREQWRGIVHRGVE
jgi:hypothetical protein